MTESEPYRAPTFLDCPHCGETSPIDPTVLPIQCPACKHVLSATVECAQCRRSIPYKGDPREMTACSNCGADPLAPVGSGLRWQKRLGSAGMLLAALVTIALIAITIYILYKRFLQR